MATGGTRFSALGLRCRAPRPPSKAPTAEQMMLLHNGRQTGRAKGAAHAHSRLCTAVGCYSNGRKKDHQRREPASPRIIVVSRQTATKHHVPLDTPSSPRQGQRQRRPWRCCRMDDRRAGGVQLHRRTAGCSLRWAAEALDDQRPSTTSPGIENDHCYEQAIRNETPRAA